MATKAFIYKTMILVAMVFVLGAGTAVTLYATGNEVIETSDVMYMVSHTEYRYNEPGQIVTRLVDFQDDPVAVTNCTATILYPDKSVFLGPSLMNATNTITGDHYYMFTTPSGPEGTYEYQAICLYGPGGSKSKSATNSFHLSSALGGLQASVDKLNNTVLSINTSLGGSISALGAQLSAVNLSISSSISSFKQEVQANFSTVLNNLAAMNATLGNLNVSVDLTPVISRLDYMNATQTAMAVTLNNVNATTTSTYSYLTGTLATNVNSILGTLGIINATVNRIEQNTLQINSTTQQILQNQNDQVYMSVYSG